MSEILDILVKEIEEKTGLTPELVYDRCYFIGHGNQHILISIIAGTPTVLIHRFKNSDLDSNIDPDLTEIDLNHPQSIDTIIQTITKICQT
jgi:hypothetical protein